MATPDMMTYGFLQVVVITYLSSTTCIHTSVHIPELQSMIVTHKV